MICLHLLDQIYNGPKCHISLFFENEKNEKFLNFLSSVCLIHILNSMTPKKLFSFHSKKNKIESKKKKTYKRT
jgi:hypothetical protein